MRKSHKLGQVDEVTELSGTYYRDEVLVVVRCYRIPEGRGSENLQRFEVSLEGHGHRAVFDLPGSDEDLARDVIQDALCAFTATIRLRDGCANTKAAARAK